MAQTRDRRLSLADILDPDSDVVEWLIADMAARTETAPHVGSMLAWKMVAYHAASAALSPWADGTPATPPAPADLALIIDDGLVTDAHTTGAAAASELLAEAARDDLVTSWWAELTLPLIDRWRSCVRVGRAGLTALAVSQATAAVAAAAPGDLAARLDRCHQFLALLDDEHQRMAVLAMQRNLTGDRAGDWQPLVVRTACCLRYRLDDGLYCLTCNLLDDDQRTELLANAGKEWARPQEPQ